MNRLRLSLLTGDALLNFEPDECLSSIEFSEEFSFESRSTSSRSKSLPGLLTRNETPAFGDISDLGALPQPPLSRWDSTGTNFTTTSTQAVKEGQGSSFPLSNAVWHSKNTLARRSSAPDRAPSQTRRRTSFVTQDQDTAPKQTPRRTSIVAPDTAPKRTSRKSRLSWRKQVESVCAAAEDKQDGSCSPPVIHEQVTEKQAQGLGLKSSSKESGLSLQKQDKCPLRVRRQSTKSQASSRRSQPSSSCRAA